MPSSTLLVLWCSWMSTVGASRSRKACGAFGISSDRSFTYTFSIENTGWFCGWLMERPCGKSGKKRRARRSGVGEQRVQAARAVERGEVVVPADVALADVDLRHGAASRALHHLLPLLGLEVDADLLDRLHALGLEQPLRHQAEGAYPGRIHQHPGHRVTSPRAGSPVAM